MRTLLIINPSSGQGLTQLGKRRLLKASHASLDAYIRITGDRGDAERFAREAILTGFERLIVAGGDGTVNEVINGMGDARIPLGIIPLGTGNVLAHDLSLPPNSVESAIEVILRGNIREVDLGLAGGRRFLLMAGFGLDAEVVDSVSPMVKDLVGRIAYAPAAIQQLVKYEGARFTLVFDEAFTYETDAYAVVAANCGTYASAFKLIPDAQFDDGLLDVLVFEKTPGRKLRLIGDAIGAIFQGYIAEPNAAHFKARRIRILSEPSVKMQLDGDVRGQTDVSVEVLPRALRLIVP